MCALIIELTSDIGTMFNIRLIELQFIMNNGLVVPGQKNVSQGIPRDREADLKRTNCPKKY